MLKAENIFFDYCASNLNLKLLSHVKTL